MILTPDYLRLAVFNSPVDYTTQGDRYYFTVDKIVYEVLFESYSSHDEDLDENLKQYVVDFRIHDYQGTKEERLAFYNKVTGRNLRLFQFYDDGRPLSGMLGVSAYQITRTGNSLPIFSSVIKIIEEFASRRNVDCFLFDAYEPSRQKLYATILRQMEKKGFYTNHSKMTNKTKFEICREEGQLRL